MGRALGFAIEPVRRLDDEIWIGAERGDRDALAQIDKATELELARLTDEGFSGTAQDIRKGRRTEIDFMNGYVADRGRAAGVPAPTHEALTELVKRIEQGDIKQGPAHISSLLR
ncbi:MAG: 2-dehydropantoate 2-reductase [Betaproteobacteria bacterium]|nr:2-dehydropantoate 2-reductase [Betaproteobacteria bacterium]MEA3154428.1 2-dehydropantoate 2-reductase [Betaproteobacteria bacterium]